MRGREESFLIDLQRLTTVKAERLVELRKAGALPCSKHSATVAYLAHHQVHNECHSYSLSIGTLHWQPLTSSVCHRPTVASATRQQGPLADTEIHQIIAEVRLKILVSAVIHWTSPKLGGFATSGHTTALARLILAFT